MAPVFELLFDAGDEDEEVPEVGVTAEEVSPKSDDVAPPVAETVAPEAPSNTPGACSGVSRIQDVGVKLW